MEQRYHQDDVCRMLFDDLLFEDELEVLVIKDLLELHHVIHHLHQPQQDIQIDIMILAP